MNVESDMGMSIGMDMDIDEDKHNISIELDTSPLRYYREMNNIMNILQILKKANFTNNMKLDNPDVSDDAIKNTIIDFFIKEYPEYYKNKIDTKTYDAIDLKQLKPVSNQQGNSLYNLQDNLKNSFLNPIQSSVSVSAGGASEDIEKAALIRSSDNAHDFNAEICNKNLSYLCDIKPHAHHSEKQVLYKDFRYLHNNKNYDDDYNNNSDDFKGYKYEVAYNTARPMDDANDTTNPKINNIKDILNRNFPSEIIYVIDFDYGGALDLLLELNASNKYIYKGVEVNYDSAGKKSDEKIISIVDSVGRNIQVMKSDTSVYYPPTLKNMCDLSFSLPYQQFFTDRKIYLLSSNDESAALIQTNTIQDDYVLVDKKFGQKGDKNIYNFSEVKNNFLKFLKGNSSFKGVYEGVKFSEEHLIAKRLGDACQALAALYLTNSVLVTHDRILAAFALFIGVKHVIHCHPKQENDNFNKLTLYYDKIYGANIEELIPNLQSEVGIKVKSFNEANVDINKVASDVGMAATASLSAVNEYFSKIMNDMNTSIINIPSDDNLITNYESLNASYNTFINNCNIQLIQIYEYKLLKQKWINLNNYLNEIKNYINLYNSFTQIKDEQKEEKVSNLNLQLSSLTKILKLKSVIEEDEKKQQLNLKPTTVKNLKIYQKPSIFGRKIRSIFAMNESDFEKESKFSIIEKVILELKVIADEGKQYIIESSTSSSSSSSTQKLFDIDYLSNVKTNIITKFKNANKHGTFFNERLKNIEIQKPITNRGGPQRGGMISLYEKHYINKLINNNEHLDNPYVEEEIITCLQEIYFHFKMLNTDNNLEFISKNNQEQELFITLFDEIFIPSISNKESYIELREQQKIIEELIELDELYKLYEKPSAEPISPKSQMNNKEKFKFEINTNEQKKQIQRRFKNEENTDVFTKRQDEHQQQQQFVRNKQMQIKRRQTELTLELSNELSEELMYNKKTKLEILTELSVKNSSTFYKIITFFRNNMNDIKIKEDIELEVHTFFKGYSISKFNNIDFSLETLTNNENLIKTYQFINGLQQTNEKVNYQMIQQHIQSKIYIYNFNDDDVLLIVIDYLKDIRGDIIIGDDIKSSYINIFAGLIQSQQQMNTRTSSIASIFSGGNGKLTSRRKRINKIRKHTNKRINKKKLNKKNSNKHMNKNKNKKYTRRHK